MKWQYGWPKTQGAFLMSIRGVGIARRYLRTAMYMMCHWQIYLPENLRENSSIDERREYYQMIWPYLLNKWKKYDAHEVAFAPENPLGQWRDMVQNVYGITLKIK